MENNRGFNNDKKYNQILINGDFINMNGSQLTNIVFLIICIDYKLDKEIYPDMVNLMHHDTE